MLLLQHFKCKHLWARWRGDTKLPTTEFKQALLDLIEIYRTSFIGVGKQGKKSLNASFVKERNCFGDRQPTRMLRAVQFRAAFFTTWSLSPDATMSLSP
jgi:hypothetical protein